MRLVPVRIRITLPAGIKPGHHAANNTTPASTAIDDGGTLGFFVTAELVSCSNLLQPSAINSCDLNSNNQSLAP